MQVICLRKGNFSGSHTRASRHLSHNLTNQRGKRFPIVIAVRGGCGLTDGECEQAGKPVQPKGNFPRIYLAGAITIRLEIGRRSGRAG
jgi:hypothetical protein